MRYFATGVRWSEIPEKFENYELKTPNGVVFGCIKQEGLSEARPFELYLRASSPDADSDGMILIGCYETLAEVRKTAVSVGFAEINGHWLASGMKSP